MRKHILYEIDLEKRKALCVVCGYTDIHVSRTRTQTKPKISCINTARKAWLDNIERKKLGREERRSKPDWKPRHILSGIDEQSLTANCAVCGPTEIRKIISRGYARYDCLTMVRQYLHEYKRARYVGRSSNPHALSLIDEQNKTAFCATCGLTRIEIYGTKQIRRRCINAPTYPKKVKRKSSLWVKLKHEEKRNDFLPCSRRSCFILFCRRGNRLFIFCDAYYIACLGMAFDRA